MTYAEALILGIVQGVTEFLPISSSGHLIAARSLFEFPLTGTLAFDVLLHLATLAVIIVYFWSDICRLAAAAWGIVTGKSVARRDTVMIGAILLGTVPAVGIGLIFEDIIETTLRDPMIVVFALLVGSVLFALAERFASSRKEITVRRGLWIGWFQALALIPGMSRSGSTIAGGLLIGLRRADAISFAFLLGVPVIFGAGLRTMLGLSSVAEFVSGPVLLGAAAAFLSGLAAVHFLVRFLSVNRLTPFIIYRVVIAVLLFFIITL